mmetsp:Transcript_22458/g.48881  ORF Transcript_22458/g.48881 Transcript_22458/m.48881 type:complete len:248 (-) Transcript_22458:452-1195(-)
MGIVSVGQESGSENFVHYCSCEEASHHCLGIRNINHQILNTIQQNLKAPFHLLIPQRIRMQTRQQPTNQLPLPRSLIQTQRDRPLDHFRVILTTLQLVNTTHNLVGIGRVKVFTYCIRYADFEFRERKHGTKHRLVMGRIIDVGLDSIRSHFIRHLRRRKNIRIRISIFFRYIKGIILIEIRIRSVFGSIDGIEPFAFTRSTLLFVTRVITAGGGGIRLFAGDVATGGSFFNVFGGMLVIDGFGGGG